MLVDVCIANQDRYALVAPYLDQAVLTVLHAPGAPNPNPPSPAPRWWLFVCVGALTDPPPWSEGPCSGVRQALKDEDARPGKAPRPQLMGVREPGYTSETTGGDGPLPPFPAGDLCVTRLPGSGPASPRC